MGRGLLEFASSHLGEGLEDSGHCVQDIRIESELSLVILFESIVDIRRLMSDSTTWKCSHLTSQGPIH
jgi:hypothetical protein